MVIHQKRFVGKKGLLVFPLLVFLVDPAFAALEEIVVTARKREENLQELPMSVSAINSETIERLGIRNLDDVTRYTPGVNLDSSFGLNDQRLTIRGLSPSRGRPNSATLVDGIDLTTESVSTAGGSMFFNSRLLDIERVEVVKGPQSALYGRAAFTGAIQYVTKDPSDEFEAEVGLDVGNYDKRYVTASVGGPVADNVGLRLNFMSWNDDGFYREGFTGSSLGGGDGYGLSLVGKWDVSDSFSARARVAYSDDEFDQQATFYDPYNESLDPPPESVGVGLITPTRYVSVFTGTPPGADGRQAYLTPNPNTGEAYEGGTHEVLNTALTLNWDVLAGTITSYTGYATADSSQVIDGDFEVRPNIDFTVDESRGGTELDFDTDTNLFSQELRYASNFDGPLQFTVGALWWQESVDQVENGISALFFPFGPNPFNNIGGFNEASQLAQRIPSEVSRDTESYSVYGLVDWSISDNWRLSMEGRYGREKMTVRGAGCDPDAPMADLHCNPNTLTNLAFEFPLKNYEHGQRVYAVDSVSNNFFAPKVVLEWVPMDDLLTYVSVSKGVKPGGISTISAGNWLDRSPADGNLDERKFADETLIAYELGVKSTFWDQRVQLNSAFFFQDYKDKQVPVQSLSGETLVTSIENAGDAEVLGLELELIWQTSANTRLQVGYSYLDGEYTSLEYETQSANSIARAGNCQLVVAANPVNNTCLISLTGNSLEDIAEHSLVGLVGWYPPLGSGGLNGLLEADVLYQSDRFADEFNDRGLDAVTIVNTRLGLQSARWSATFYVNNVFDDDTIRSWSAGTGVVSTAERTDGDQGGFPADGFSIAPPPRHYGVRANVRF